MRFDETWHRLREWTNGQASSERLAAQALASEGFNDLDPSHPLGGRDGGRDAVYCTKNGKRWVMAVYFPRGQQRFGDIETKFHIDLEGAKGNSADGMAFVTNQELTLSERRDLHLLASPMDVELFHLERLTAILDKPAMKSVRNQFLGIVSESPSVIKVGGDGGNAPGAGGGGGGAIGPGAIGGDGGTGGDWSTAAALLTDIMPGLSRAFAELPRPGDPSASPSASLEIGGGGGRAPGAGGGGGGVIIIPPGAADATRNVQLNGSDALAFGAGGGGGGAIIVAAERTVSGLDFENGFQVSGMYLADYAQIRNGLLNCLGAGWDHFKVDSLPLEVSWGFVCSFACGRIERGTALELFVVVRNEARSDVFRERFVLVCEDRPGILLIHRVFALRFKLESKGIWSVSIESGRTILAVTEVEIRL